MASFPCKIVTSSARLRPLWKSSMFDRLLVRITETSDSELPVVTQFISALLFPTNLLPRIHWAFFKMVDKGEWEFTWNNELKGKRLQENLRFGEASCGLQNRDEILVDTWVHYTGKVSAQPHTIVKQICFPNGNVLFLSLFSLFKNWMHNVVWGCAEILPLHWSSTSN